MGRLQRMTELLMQSTGLAGLEAMIAPMPGAIVLMYHSVADERDRAWIDPANNLDPDLFRAQMSFLAKHRTVISMNELVGAMAQSRELPAGAVVLTFDDGYLNNLRVATPILREFGLAATMYLPTKHIDGGETQWIDRLFVAFSRRTRSVVSLGGGERGDVQDEGTRRRAIEHHRTRLLSASYAQREAALRELEDDLRPEGTPPRTTMNWDDVRRLRTEHAGWEIGVHTVEHRDLSVCDLPTIGAEIAGCVATFEREIGDRPRHFSFPYGRSTAASRGLVGAAEIQSAVASRADGQVRSGEDVLWIPRVQAPRSFREFRARTSAAYPGVLGRLGRLS